MTVDDVEIDEKDGQDGQIREALSCKMVEVRSMVGGTEYGKGADDSWLCL